MLNDPIIEPYSRIIEAFASQSPKAHGLLNHYYAQHNRTTVAAKHFVILCRWMESAAEQDKVTARRTDGTKSVSAQACPYSASSGDVRPW